MLRKIFTISLLIGALIAANPINAIEESNGYVGFNMYRFPKPKIAKEATIINVFPNSPAWEAGIRVADRILKVNDVDVTESSVSDIQKLIVGKIGGSVKINLKKKERGKKFFFLTRTGRKIKKI